MASNYVDPFDNPQAAAAAPPQAARPGIIDPFDSPPPQQAGAVVTLPPVNPVQAAQDPTVIPNMLPFQPDDGWSGAKEPPPPRHPAWPPSLQHPLGPRGSVPLNRNDPAGDAYGGHAGFLTTLKASMVPETDEANVRKKFRILSQGMGIPEDRFFMDDAGNIRWADTKGQSHLVSPTIGGGSTADLTDLASRVGNQIGANFGSMIGPTAGGAAAMATGPLGGAAVAGAVDGLRQIAGNWIAGQDKPWQDLSYSNMAWQAAGTGAVELAGQIGSALITRFLQPGNPYNLRDGEIRQLQTMMDKARSRAGTAERTGMQATPYDLTDLEFLRRLEQTVAKQPGYAGDIMKAYYDQRADFNFPEAVSTLFKQISPQGTPLVGLDKLQRGAEETIAHLRNTQVSQGTRNGWGDAIASGAKPDVRAAVAEIQSRIEHTSGPVKEKLQQFLGELRDGQTLVTDFERLHNIRLDMEATLDGYRRNLPVEQRGRLTEVLGPIFSKFDAALEAAHPAYAKGTEAYAQAGNAVETIRDGVLTMLSQNPSIAGNLGKTLFRADAEAVEQARKLFIAAGRGDDWNAGVRAVLQNNVDSSAGAKVSSGFANKTAPFGNHRQALDAAVPEGVRADLNNVLDIGKAQGRVVHGPNRGEVENIRLEDQAMGGTPVADAIRATLSPFRFLRTLGDEAVHRAYNKNAVEMAMDLTGQRGLMPPPEPPGWLWRTPARPIPNKTPSTAEVLKNLEDTAASPFQGWQRHAFERAVNAAGTASTRGLLSQPDPTDPQAIDLQRGLLFRPLH